MPSMPDITPATVVALVQAVLGVALAFGLNLDTAQQGELLGLVAALAALLLHHDVKLRGNRAKHIVGPLLDTQAATKIADAARATQTPPPRTDPIKAATDTLADEAKREAAAHAENQAPPTLVPAPPAPGIDPATL